MVFSLADVTGTIENESYGQIQFGGGNQQVGSIGYEFQDEAFKMETFADGGAVISHNASKAGSVTIKMGQTSPKYYELLKYIRWCKDNPQLAESNITIRSNTGIIQCLAEGCFPSKVPGIDVSDSPSDASVNFLSTKITTPNEV